MTEGIAELIAIFEDTSWAALLIFLRVGAMIALVPAFGEQAIPARVRLALAFAFSLIIGPAVAPMVSPTPDVPHHAVGQAGAEVLTGLFFGFILRLFIIALQIAGTIAAQSTSLSQIFGATAGVDPLPAMGNILVIGGLAIAVISGLHVSLAQYIISGFDLVRPGTVIRPSLVAEVGLLEVMRCMSLAFTLAAPFVVASLIYNITLGVINRAMPQLMVAFVGAPAITAGGLALLALASPMILALWQSALFETLDAPFGPLR